MGEDGKMSMSGSEMENFDLFIESMELSNVPLVG